MVCLMLCFFVGLGLFIVWVYFGKCGMKRYLLYFRLEFCGVMIVFLLKIVFFVVSDYFL